MENLKGKYLDFYNQIQKTIPNDRIFTDELHLLTYGTEGSFYRLTPKIILRTENIDEIQEILKLSNELSLPITFRAGGTSLSGQSITDSILVMTSRDWNKITVNDDKTKITMQPSVLGAHANTVLAPFAKKIGPDPASVDRAMIAGIVANNGSGMCCGVVENSYETVADMKIVLVDGTEVDTADEKSRESFRKSHKEFLDKLSAIRERILANQELHDKIVKKYSIKNVTGYAINSFLKASDPIDIMKYLMVGSEGTLVFMKEITLNTVENYKDRASALVLFPTLKEACEAITVLKQDCEKEVDAGELLDKVALKAISNKPGLPDYLKGLEGDETALLIETRAPSKEELQKNIQTITEKLETKQTVVPVSFTTVKEEYMNYWQIRKGVFPASVGNREKGTTSVIEDIACPIEHLAEMATRLQGILDKHKYENTVIYGHALEGNFHFMINQQFETPEQIKQYDDMMLEVIEMIAKDYGGSLKAEHGTGRNMAPFVEYEWGSDAYEIMKEIKQLFDPKELLNPGVIINDDPEIHIKNFKKMPATDDLIDMCIECGYCESTCPSNMITLSPRQRIVTQRYMTSLKEKGETEKLKEYEELYQFEGIDTCATCQLCSIACPLDIDTGLFTKKLKSQQTTPLQNKVANAVANNFGFTLSAGKFALNAVNAINKVIPDSFISGASKGLRKISKEAPLWTPSLPKGNNFNIKPTLQSKKKVVYFSSCINRTMANPKQASDESSLGEIVVILLERAGYEIIVPEDINSLCCGMPFSSKGFKKQGQTMSDELESALKKASKNGAYPILCDMSPCSKTMSQNFSDDVKVHDSVEFIMDYLIDDLEFKQIDDSVVIHTTCSVRKMGQAEKLADLARLCSTNVTIPLSVNCCGFAGDKGFTLPQLNESALRNLKAEIPAGTKYAFSTSKTCEIGLTENSGLDYKSIFYLVERCTR